MCNNCAGEKNICAKCLESREIMPTNIKTEKELIQEQVDLERLLAGMTERERRSYLRQMERKNKKRANGEEVSENDEDDSEEGSEDEDSEDESEDEK